MRLNRRRDSGLLKGAFVTNRVGVDEHGACAKAGFPENPRVENWEICDPHHQAQDQGGDYVDARRKVLIKATKVAWWCL